ncbi:MAG: hypothetical protein EZS28_006245 [Streblomastix strix]|uniref:Uncharacterized protein n=1 Tax=Streblomastix strix TaxID=222440 RepID=A0A5J4WTJ3_9EUKA|nr:MAG: hypothetical protein EZS28_006245 [Streblomastix strix]
MEGLMQVYCCGSIVGHYYFLNVCYFLQFEILCFQFAIQNSKVHNLLPASFLIWDREYWIPVLNGRIRGLGYYVVFQFLLDNLGQTRVCLLVPPERDLMFQGFMVVRTVLVCPGKRI